MAKIHHVHDRSIEHAKSRDTMAHRLITPTDGALRSTRGHAAGAVVGGKTVRPLPTVDVQARHGGKAKGGTVAHSWGNTPQQIAQDGTRRVGKIAYSLQSKRTAKPAIHNGMRGHAALDINDGSGVLSGAVKSGSTKLPGDCDNG